MRMLYKNHFLKIAFFCLHTGLSSHVFSSAREDTDDQLHRSNMFMRQEMSFVCLDELSVQPAAPSTVTDETSEALQEPFGVYLPTRPSGVVAPSEAAPVKRESIPVLILTCSSDLAQQCGVSSSSSISKSCPETSSVSVISSPEQEGAKKLGRCSGSTIKSRKKSCAPLSGPLEVASWTPISFSKEPKFSKASVHQRRHRARSEITHLHGRDPNKFAPHHIKTPSVERSETAAPRGTGNLLLKLAQSPLNSATSGMRAVSIQDTGLFFSASRLARSEGEASPRCSARAEFLKTPFSWVESLTLQGLMCEHSLSFYLDIFPNLSEVIVASCRNVEYARATSGPGFGASTSAHLLSPRACIFKGLAQIADYVKLQTGDIRLQAFGLPHKVEVTNDEVNEALVKAGLTGFEFVGSHTHIFDGASRSLYMFRKS